MYSPLIKGYATPKYYKLTRDHVIDTITIHHMAGNMLAENCVKWMAGDDAPKNRSCNYAIGSNGEIWGGCPEESESYCSSDRANDTRAITIEVANDGGDETGWHVSDKAISAIVELLVDICKRHSDTIQRLRWEADQELIGQVDRQNMTLHRWFSSVTICPGPYLESQFPAIVRRVNARLTEYEAEKPAFGQTVYSQAEKDAVLDALAEFILGYSKKGGENSDT